MKFQDRENQEIKKTQWKIKKSLGAIEKSRNPMLVVSWAGGPAGGRGFQDRENQEIEKTQGKIKKSLLAIKKSSNPKGAHPRCTLPTSHRFLDFSIARLDFLIFHCVFSISRFSRSWKSLITSCHPLCPWPNRAWISRFLDRRRREDSRRPA